MPAGLNHEVNLESAFPVSEISVAKVVLSPICGNAVACTQRTSAGTAGTTRRHPRRRDASEGFGHPEVGHPEVGHPVVGHPVVRIWAKLATACLVTEESV